MSFVHATNGRIFVNDNYQSSRITGYTFQHTRKYGETTTLADSGDRAIPGLAAGKVTLKALFDSSASGLDVEMQGAVGVDDSLLVTAYPDLANIGQPAFIAVCDPEDYSVNADLKDAVKTEITGMPGDGVDWGVCLHGFSAETGSTNSASVDNTASSANGGVASLHVTTFSGLTNSVIKIQHSTNNSTWADLVTFATVTGATYERQLVAAGTTVNRYLRAVVTVTGVGTHTYVVAFARR